jgi:hypothetical protein
MRYAACLRRLYFLLSGQRHWSDTSQLGVYIDDYHVELDKRLNTPRQGSEMITELYVPPLPYHLFWQRCAQISAGTGCN